MAAQVLQLFAKKYYSNDPKQEIKASNNSPNRSFSQSVNLHEGDKSSDTISGVFTRKQ